MADADFDTLQARTIIIDGSSVPTGDTSFNSGQGLISGRRIGQVELQAMFGYGHSYMAGDGTGIAGGNYALRVQARSGAGSLTRRAIGGSGPSGIAIRAAGTAGFAYVAGTKGFVVWDGFFNTFHRTGYTTQKAKNGLIEGLRAFLAIVSASSRFEQTAMTRVGTWTLTSNAAFSGGSRHASSTSGDYAEGTVTVTAAGKVDILLSGTDDAASGIFSAGPFTVTVDGVFHSVGTASDKYNVNASVEEPALAGPYVHTVGGLTPGNHLIRITKTDNTFTYVDAFLVRSATPPPIIVMPMIKPNFAATAILYAQPVRTNEERLAMNSDTRALASQFPNLFVAELDAGFSSDFMLGSDTIHLNDAGQGYYADQLEAVIRKIPFTLGFMTSI